MPSSSQHELKGVGNDLSPAENWCRPRLHVLETPAAPLEVLTDSRYVQLQVFILPCTVLWEDVYCYLARESGRIPAAVRFHLYLRTAVDFPWSCSRSQSQSHRTSVD